MSSTSPGGAPPADHVTCPYGHTFPTTQLTVRAGQYVCPVCDGARWAAPAAQRAWSRTLLAAPLTLAALAVLLEIGVQITTLGLGSVYLDQHLGGSGWLVFEGALSLVGVAAVVVGLVAMAAVLRSSGWTRRRMTGPMMLIGLGLLLNGIAGLFGMGFNLAMLDASYPGSSWQLAGQLLDAFSQLLLGAVGVWIAFLLTAPGQGPAGAQASGAQASGARAGSQAPAQGAGASKGATPPPPAGSPSQPPQGTPAEAPTGSPADAATGPPVEAPTGPSIEPTMGAPVDPPSGALGAPPA